MIKFFKNKKTLKNSKSIILKNLGLMICLKQT